MSVPMFREKGKGCGFMVFLLACSFFGCRRKWWRVWIGVAEDMRMRMG